MSDFCCLQPDDPDRQCKAKRAEPVSSILTKRSPRKPSLPLRRKHPCCLQTPFNLTETPTATKMDLSLDRSISDSIKWFRGDVPEHICSLRWQEEPGPSVLSGRYVPPWLGLADLLGLYNLLPPRMWKQVLQWMERFKCRIFWKQRGGLVR